MSRYVETDAVLLEYKNRGEMDRVLTLYTRDLGRVDAYGKSIRAGSSKLKGHGVLFANSRVMLVSAGGLWRLVDMETIRFPHDAPSNAVFLGECARFLLRLVTHEESNEKLWDVICTLPYMKGREGASFFKARVLWAQGLLPDEARLSLFFTPHATQFLSGETGGEFLADDEETRKFNSGIERILLENHVV